MITKKLHRLALACIFAVALPASLAFAANSAIDPKPRDEKWVKRHEGFVEIAKTQTDCQVLFIGDSITDGWRNNDKGHFAIWERNFGQYKPVNFGISGDRTQHLLWRLKQGEIGKLKPKAIVMMIGTNNTGFEDKEMKKPRNTPAEIAEGIAEIVTYLRKELPDSKIMLLAVFPRGEKDNLQRGQVNEINAIIKNLNDGKKVFYLDINQKFLDEDGTLPRDIMPDLLHPNKKGYEIWADAIREPLAKLVK